MPPAKKPPDWTDSERAHLLELARDRDRRQWLGGIIKRWATWVAAVVVGARFVWDGLTTLIQHITKGQP